MLHRSGFLESLEASKSDLSYNPQAPSSGQKTKINLYHSTPAPYPGQGSYTIQKDLRQEQLCPSVDQRKYSKKVCGHTSKLSKSTDLETLNLSFSTLLMFFSVKTLFFVL